MSRRPEARQASSFRFNQLLVAFKHITPYPCHFQIRFPPFFRNNFLHVLVQSLFSTCFFQQNAFSLREGGGFFSSFKNVWNFEGKCQEKPVFRFASAGFDWNQSLFHTREQIVSSKAPSKEVFFHCERGPFLFQLSNFPFPFLVFLPSFVNV